METDLYKLLELIMSVAGLLTIISPLIGSYVVLTATKRQSLQMSGITLSELSVVTQSDGTLRKVLYFNGVFGSVALLIKIFLQTDSLGLSLLMASLLFAFFFFSAYYLRPEEKKYRKHTAISFALSIYLLLLKFGLGILFDIPISVLLGLIDLAGLGFILCFRDKQADVYSELFLGVNLSIWVLIIFVI